jgi:CBS domain containing-hemolysin-like protein
LVPTWQWIIGLLALIASAFFSSAETALTALGEARVQALIDSGRRRARLLRLWQKHPDRILSALLLGNTLVNVGMGALTALIADEMGASHAVALLTAATTLIILLFGEITPKTFAKAHASGYALFVIPFVALTYWVLFPLAWLFVQLPRAISKAAGVPQSNRESVTSRELEYLIELGARQGSIDKVREQLLSSVLAFTEVLVKEIMIPRTQVVALEESASFDETLRLVSESELSRIPVYRNSLDEIVGILYVKSLLKDVKKGIEGQFQLSSYLRKPFFVPEVMKVSKLLTEMQKERTHLAVVVDEFGGTSGIVTLEDVVEEIVGEIHDESDIEDKKIKVLPDGVILADAQISIRDLENHLAVEFPPGDYETLGGFLTATAGRVPPAGSLVVWGGLTFTVKAADDRRVQKVEIARKPASGSAVTGPHSAPDKAVLQATPPPDKVH